MSATFFMVPCRHNPVMLLKGKRLPAGQDRFSKFELIVIEKKRKNIMAKANHNQKDNKNHSEKIRNSSQKITAAF